MQKRRDRFFNFDLKEESEDECLTERRERGRDNSSSSSSASDGD